MSDLPKGLGEAVTSILFPTPDATHQDPAAWVRVNLDEFVPEHQAKIMKSVAVNRYTAVQSCHAMGKSFLASRLMLWWLQRFPAGDAFVVTTAPTVKQIQAILWREFRRATVVMTEAGTRPIRMTMDASAYMQVGNHEELVAFGRKPADHDPAAFSGIHAKNVLVIIDEAGGISHQMWEAVDTLVTNDGSHVLAIGNPDDPAAHFEEVCREGSGWNVIVLDALKAPTFTEDALKDCPLTRKLMEDEGIEPSTEVIPQELKDLLVSPVWVEERIKRWGATSPVFTSKVRGRFPEVSETSVISPYLVRKAIAKMSTTKQTDGGVAAFDVASTGKDESVGYLMRDGIVSRLYSDHGSNTMKLAGYITDFHRKNPETQLVVDYNGLGRGVYDRLREMMIPVIGFGAGEASRHKKRYANKRSEGWWTLRTMLEQEQLTIDALDKDLHAQLQAPQWSLRSTGQTIVEPKDDMKKRGVASPDRADAVMMAAYYYSRATTSKPVTQNIFKDAIESAVLRMGLNF